MDLNSIIYSEEASKILLVVNAKDLRDFAESMMAWGMKTIKERDEPTYYSREEMLQLLHVTDPTLLEYRRKGLIPEPIKVEGKVLYNKAEVHEALTKNRVGRWRYKK